MNKHPLFVICTFTFESLSYESPQHLSTVVAEGRRSVRVDKQTVWTDLEVLHRGWRCRNDIKEPMSFSPANRWFLYPVCWILVPHTEFYLSFLCVVFFAFITHPVFYSELCVASALVSCLSLSCWLLNKNTMPKHPQQVDPVIWNENKARNSAEASGCFSFKTVEWVTTDVSIMLPYQTIYYSDKK